MSSLKAVTVGILAWGKKPTSKIHKERRVVLQNSLGAENSLESELAMQLLQRFQPWISPVRERLLSLLFQLVQSLRIFIISYPFSVRLAVLNDPNPIPDLINRFMARWSCSTILIRYLFCRNSTFKGQRSLFLWVRSQLLDKQRFY